MSTLLLPSVLLSSMLSSSAAPPPPRTIVESRPTAEPPAIDGDASDWKDALIPLAGLGVSIAVRHDRDAVYVVVVATEPSARELLARAGFTLWWDATGRQRKATGVIVPPIVTLVPPERPEEGRTRRGGGPVRDVDAVGHLVWIGPREDDRRRLELTYLRTVGVDAAGAETATVVAYELRVPQPAPDTPFAIALANDGRGTLAIETKKAPKYRPPDRGRRAGGAFGGLGGLGGGSGGRGPGGGGSGRPPGSGDDGPVGEFAADPFERWIEVRLAPVPG